MASTQAAVVYQPKSGDWLKPDQWRFGGHLSESDWEQAQFRVETCHVASGPYLPTKSGYVELAVDVKVTGTKLRRPAGSIRLAYRCQVTFVGDGEPDTVTGGWIYPQEMP